MNMHERLAQGGFLRLIEVFPPSFTAERKKEPLMGLKQKMRDFLERVKRIQNLADAILIADVKDLTRIRLSTIYSAAIVQEEVGIEAVPVITARDSNRPAIRSAILTALSYGLSSMMFVWGDSYREHDEAKNVYDYRGLGEVLREAREISERAGSKPTFFAPVDLSKLDSSRGRRIAQSRLRNGASYLLAQPPTVDETSTLLFHRRKLKNQRLDSRVLLNVFPFTGAEDIEKCREKFGWSLPSTLDKIARGGEAALLREARKVAERLEEEGSPGVYVSTRGRPELARFILD